MWRWPICKDLDLIRTVPSEVITICIWWMIDWFNRLIYYLLHRADETQQGRRLQILPFRLESALVLHHCIIVFQPSWCPSGCMAPVWRLHTNLYKCGKKYLRRSCIYLLSFLRIWTLSIERFWSLFWSILNDVTLKTSNRFRRQMLACELIMAKSREVTLPH